MLDFFHFHNEIQDQVEAGLENVAPNWFLMLLNPGTAVSRIYQLAVMQSLDPGSQAQ